MPKKNVTKKPQPAPPKVEEMSDKTTAVDKAIVYAVFLIFKLINYLTSYLPKRNISGSNFNEDTCLQIQTTEESIISVTLPKNFESAIKDCGELKNEVQYLKKINSDLKKKLRNTKQDYTKCMKNLESANVQINRLANSNPLTCKNCERIDDEGRLKICKAIDQTYIKFEHLRLKCQYGVEDLRKIRCGPAQTSHVRDIADYHISSLEHFIQWMDMKMNNIQKFDHFIKYQTNTVNVADILNHADLNDVVSTMHISLMHFFKKYYVLLMITISDKEYIENCIHTQPKQPTVSRQEKYDESTQTFAERPKCKGKATYGVDNGDELITDNDFLEKNGRYHNLYIFLADYLNLEPKVLIECMLKVKKNNNNSFHNLTVFDIANKVEEVYRTM